MLHKYVYISQRQSLIMTSTIQPSGRKSWWGLVLIVLSTSLLFAVTPHWAPAIIWMGGLLTLWFGVKLLATKQELLSKVPFWGLAGIAAISPTLLVIFIHILGREAYGWHGFLHLADIKLSAWLSILCLWSPAIGLWLLSYNCLSALQKQNPDRPQRLLVLIGASVVVNSLNLFLPLSAGILPMVLITVVFLAMLDLYLDSSRTSSLTWLLSWLLLFSLFLAAYSFRQSLAIDQLALQQLAEEIEQEGQPPAELTYPLTLQWDTIGQSRADTLLSEELLQLGPESGRVILSPGRIDWVRRSKDGHQWVITGRPSGGYRPPLVLSSLFFIVGLGFSLALRGSSWLLGLSVERWELPLYGPSSLRIRIQLYFFGLALIIFLLIGWFTYVFFRDQDISLQDWLDNLLALYAFLLIVAGALGIFLANSITEPIVQIGQKLGDTRLRNNEPLSWPKQDEIGRLVTNYNQMIAALDESAQRLATSERENAWREMAKQVAHEIKNPLTPMKLQLQQLQRLQKEDPERAAGWGQRVSQTLIEQIDGLAQIANEFGHFARLPEAQPAVLETHTLLESAQQLFQHNSEGVEIKLEPYSRALPLFADPNQLTRVLNNLLRNAIQAIPESRTGLITIRPYADKQYVVIDIIDDGSGVPTALRERIFEPRFTTKSSGMGLGLAMCKSIIEQAEGCLSFVSEEGKGSTFTIRLPLHDQD